MASKLDKSTLKNKILTIFLVPFGALTFIILGNSLFGILDWIHVPVFIYIMKLYYDKFREYTESNGLRIAIILLFTIIFVSFLITQLAEHVNPIDSLVMVSNAFTSNGYAILGNTIPGKVDAIVLVWSGYILSGVGTATLASAILIRHYNSKIDEYDAKLEKNEKNINEINAKLDELKEMIEKNY